MKNSINLVLLVLLLVLLGCACPRLDKLTGKNNFSQPSATPTLPDTPEPSRTTTTSSTSSLTMDKYNQLKLGMTKSEVDKILGGPGEEVSSSTGGGMTFSVYKWSGENYKSIILSFKNDKIMSKSQVGLK